MRLHGNLSMLQNTEIVSCITPVIRASLSKCIAVENAGKTHEKRCMGINNKSNIEFWNEETVGHRWLLYSQVTQTCKDNFGKNHILKIIISSLPSVAIL